MAGTRASTRQAATSSADSDGKRTGHSTSAPKGNKTAQGGRGRGKGPSAVKKVAGSRRSTPSVKSSQLFSRASSTDSSQDVRKFNELKKLEKKKAEAVQAKADAGALIFFIKRYLV